MKKLFLFLFSIIAFNACKTSLPETSPANTVSTLSVTGTHLTNTTGDIVVLQGISYSFYNNVFEYLFVRVYFKGTHRASQCKGCEVWETLVKLLKKRRL